MAGFFEQIEAQSRMGSAEGPSYFQGTMELARLGLAGRQLKLEQQRESRLQSVHELNAEATRLNNTLTGLDIEKKQLEASNAVLDRAAENQVLGLMAQLTETGQWGEPAAWEAWNQIMRTNPRAAATKPGNAFIQRMELLEENKKYQELYNGQKPASVTTTSPAGAKLTYEQQFPESEREAAARAAGLEPSGLDEKGRKQFARPREQSQTITEVGPDGTMRVIQGTGGEAKTPSGIVSKGEDLAMAADALITSGQALISLINPQNAGAHGWIKRTAKSALGILDPSIKAGPEFDYENAAVIFSQNAKRMLRTDGQMGVKELAFIDQALPTTSPTQLPDDALKKTTFMMRLVGASTRNYLTRSKLPLPDQLLTPDEIKAGMIAGRFTREQASDLLARTPFFIGDNPSALQNKTP